MRKCSDSLLPPVAIRNGVLVLSDSGGRVTGPAQWAKPGHRSRRHTRERDWQKHAFLPLGSGRR
jgi:hypothetical protein